MVPVKSGHGAVVRDCHAHPERPHEEKLQLGRPFSSPSVDYGGGCGEYIGGMQYSTQSGRCHEVRSYEARRGPL